MPKPDEDLEALERDFWFGDAAYYRERLTEGCLMIFPGMGIVGREQLIAGIESGTRWSTVSFETWRRDDPADDVAIIAYRASALRPGMPSLYRVDCGSLYVRAGELWRLAFHQQTPAA
jgi:hypothetical protein